ncbi:hypothetical protein DTO164E3_2933 [Paecilomyces variotii]|nr:hypothetical protein DTO164E3_2933 [Paecilomyces variotii]KAJ9209058.1 hypothetical protein DTO032I3_275 [Paecilomyces variotii]KAJ9282938.1 hypothetical protein DTO021D3_275 [Paecilomyces variotii]KAJ9343855.1 hypothetical protein DTO027B6_3680 [Paecilomyces variotii]KAJ9386943.1 hypothetical protein DTO032I4_3387 [Paecilomyces variotii]
MAQGIGNNLGIASALASIKPTSNEEVVMILWQTIIATWFPPYQGYKWGFKSQLLTTSNEPDGIVIQIVACVPNPRLSTEFTEFAIMLLECKRPSDDTPSGWESTVKGQFLDDLETIGNPDPKCFGAVAIGTKVRFYRFDGREETLPQKLVQIHQGDIDLSTDAGRFEVGQMMDTVKAQGWQWATT